MPYFFILPAYAALLLTLSGCAVIARCIPAARPASGYLAGGAVGTLIGLIMSNIFNLVAGVAPAWLAQQVRLPEPVQQITRLFVAAALLVGPFLASAVGVVLGFVLGLYLVHMRRRRKRSRTDKDAAASPSVKPIGDVPMVNHNHRATEPDEG